MGFIPTLIQKGSGWEECNKSHSLLKLPCSRFVGGEEATWGLLKYMCTSSITGFKSDQVWLLVFVSGGGVHVEFHRK